MCICGGISPLHNGPHMLNIHISNFSNSNKVIVSKLHCSCCNEVLDRKEFENTAQAQGELLKLKDVNLIRKIQSTAALLS